MTHDHAITTPRGPTGLARAGRSVAIGVFSCWILAGGIITACSPKGRQTPDDTIVVLLDAAVRAVDPRYTLSNYDTKLSRLIVPGLTTVDTPTTAPALMLAEAVEQRDARTWDVTVRRDARFSDGSPVTAADVVFSYESMLAVGSDSVYHKTFGERFERVEALAQHRVRFHLRRPLSTMMSDLDQGILSVRAAGPDGRFGGGSPIGAGPYRLVALTGAHALLEANPYFHSTKPALPRVEFRFVRDPAARILMLVGGSADLLQNAVRLDLIDDVAARPRVRVERAPSQLLTFLMFNNDDRVLARKEVRQAIALAIDRKRLVAAKFSGRAVLATGLLPPGTEYYEPDVTRWDYDPARARKLLDDAG
jgi:peptide/nickel transport system substrate-binding protein